MEKSWESRGVDEGGDHRGADRILCPTEILIYRHVRSLPGCPAR